MSQAYNNEWIDFSKTYYRFKVGSTGLHRIAANALPTAIASTPAQNFQLWRNGKQVPLYTSVATGVLPTNGFIQFWGEKNDGVPDKVMYRDPSYQLNDRISLQTDTAAYFLVVNANPTTANPNLRFTDAPNDGLQGSLPLETSFTYIRRLDFKEQINRGYGEDVTERITSSSYDIGEGWGTRDIYYSSPYNATLTGLFPASTGNASFDIAVDGVSYYTREVTIKFNNATYVNKQQLLNQETKVISSPVPVNTITSGTNTFNVSINIVSNDTSSNRISISYLQLTYPRLYNFTGLSNFAFTLPANAQGNYIEIPTANFAGASPVLLDVTNLKRYVAVLSGGVYKFKLQGSIADRKLILINEDASNATAINSFSTRTFTNYALASNQANYIIISHKTLFGDGVSTSNPVVQFAQYRASTAGGGFTTKIYDIDELVDQFAFGIKKHPLSIKNFIRYAKQFFAVSPTHTFLIGKGTTYEEYCLHENSPYIEQLDLVPTWGWPASDILMVSPNLDPYPSVYIGRLSAVSQQEVAIYLDKVKSYEQQRLTATQDIAGKAWMKQLVHVAGSNDANLLYYLVAALNGYRNIIQQPLFGANVSNFNTLDQGPATTAVTDYLKSLFKSGIALLTYFGHSAATQLDYQLDNPYDYDNANKYPLFLLNGCNAGNFFDYDVTRLNTVSSFSEKFVLAQQRGAIGVVASSHFGLTGYLDTYTSGFYQSLTSTAGYNNYVGKNMLDAIVPLSSYSFTYLAPRMHAEQFMLHGDPAIKVYASAQPDFTVEPQTVSISPSVISVADNKFTLKNTFYNIGQAKSDSVSILIKWKHGDGTTDTIVNQKIKPLMYIDSLIKDLVIVPTRDGGNNTITVTIDNRNEFVELSEANNTVTKDFVIFQDNARPIYPYTYSIINKANSKLYASTANAVPTNVPRNYEMQLDTTELFNSLFKITKTVSSTGGLLEFDPQTTYKDSTVYYWRVAPVPVSGPYIWSNSSFVYLNGTETGYNQSHLYQHFKSDIQRIKLDSSSRIWNYVQVPHNIVVEQSIYPYSTEDSHFSIKVDGTLVAQSACLGHSLIFSVLDPVSLKPWYNQQPTPDVVPSGTPGFYMGSASSNCRPNRRWNFEFSYLNTTERNKMAAFMDAIPNGYIVVARLNLDQDANGVFTNEPFANTWKLDGPNSVYNKLKNAGFADIDSFNRPRTWAFIYKKNTPSFQPKWAFSNDTTDAALLTKVVATADTLGYVTSPVFGPSTAWKQLKWRGSSLETVAGDAPTVDVIGINAAGVETTLLTGIPLTQQDVNISSINAVTYPYVKLKLTNPDRPNQTPYQLRYWRLIGDMVPEGALAPSIKYSSKDTLEAGEKLNFSIAFKNISDVAFSKDSIAVQLKVVNKNNVTQTIVVPHIKKPAPADTTTFNVSIDTKDFLGNNTLSVDINPNNDQPEQYHFNNFLFKNFYVNSDKINPLMDVTFDGTHILNGDIVSAKPAIRIKLKDESKYLALTDTAGVSIQLRYPDNTLRKFKYGTDTLRFTPASMSGGDNTATVDFTPTLPTDGEYELIVKGKDMSENVAGTNDYKVTFNVYNKPAITEVFNYPNPFTTSTAFVFTLTGNQVPNMLRIQILTVTGKIVKEINKDELGPIRIGRNITEYKWDGTDMYGQKLGNGVYLYRVITNLNGNSLDKFSIRDSDGNKIDTDKYFKAGYGKMYLMR
jgi:flagellar hook assembly protein FlgD